ncbi:hypothetical protein BuS5_01313 [Desulfosarcina sp. BuS5]|uniref:hypothetical protein n=1 Tax=Desulfosarcina sp. BuS5 TaxID=933262 RepID=UPI0004827838|nr:hypothetical protein [Desulfosarcina sp. BuS5]WDN88345.1 hypothetical protein BuS5_01313 [Desulfosarcina sp. BuS5]
MIVDNEAARPNVTRFLESRHFEISTRQADEAFYLTGKIDREMPDSAFSEIKEQEKPALN